MLKSKQSKRFTACMVLVVALLALSAVKPLIVGALVLLAIGGLIATMILTIIWELCA